MWLQLMGIKMIVQSKDAVGCLCEWVSLHLFYCFFTKAIAARPCVPTWIQNEVLVYSKIQWHHTSGSIKKLDSCWCFLLMSLVICQAAVCGYKENELIQKWAQWGCKRYWFYPDTSVSKPNQMKVPGPIAVSSL